MSAAATIDPQTEALVESARARTHERPHAAERLVEAAIGAAFIAAAVALALLGDSGRSFEPLTAAVLVAAYALAYRVEFEVGTGYTSPVQLVFVPMLFLLPPQIVPLLVCASFVLVRLADAALGRRHLGRLLLAPGQSWHALGPALVFTTTGLQAPSWEAWPVLVAALAAQLAFDAVPSLAADRFALQIPLRPLLSSIAWTYLVDILLAPIGLMIAVVAIGGLPALASLLPLFALLALFAQERTRRLDHALELSRAYRGTALLLGDVVEGDHEYTGSHSRHVVDLSLAVADRLGLTPAQRRNVEFGALLHDVGKIAVPKEIIDKRGPLDEDEWQLMRLHTVEGQRMLDGVGGVLSEAGRVVRASHEHWDGSGYPDGLAGEAIPIEARVCAACDAFSAMTTDRSYRKAMSLDVALAEVRAQAGRQFDPEVVAALVSIVDG